MAEPAPNAAPPDSPSAPGVSLAAPQPKSDGKPPRDPSHRHKPGTPYRGQIPLPCRLKARSLYLVQQAEIPDIAERTGLTVGQVRGLISREGWVKTRRRAREKAEARAIARTSQAVEEIVESVAIKGEELAIGTLEAASDVLRDQSGDFWAKDLQSLSQAAKNFIGIARQARGLSDAPNSSRDAGAQTVIFIAGLERVTKADTRGKGEPINVTPVPVSTASAPDGHT